MGEEYKINSGHYLELMDRIHVLACTLDDHILNHPLAEVLPDAQKQLSIALDSLMEAYQIVGHESYNYDEKNHPHIGHPQ
jgi:hypothetical protein